MFEAELTKRISTRERSPKGRTREREAIGVDRKRSARGERDCRVVQPTVRPPSLLLASFTPEVFLLHLQKNVSFLDVITHDPRTYSPLTIPVVRFTQSTPPPPQPAIAPT